jgi:hypothetical protein
MYPTLISEFDQQSLGVVPYVCRDSRNFFLGIYSLCFDGILKIPTYFAPKVDIILFSNEHEVYLFSDAVNHIP